MQRHTLTIEIQDQYPDFRQSNEGQILSRLAAALVLNGKVTFATQEISRKDELLQQTAAEANLKCNSVNKTVRVECENGDEFEFTLAQWLDALANGIYWDERGNWSDAIRVTIDSL